MSALIFYLLTAHQTAFADSAQNDPPASVRIGMCMGFDPSCFLLAGKFEITTPLVGFQLSGPIPQGAIKLYVIPSRTYFYGAFTMEGGLFESQSLGVQVAGGGVGVDFHMPEFENLMMQPQFGIQFIDVGFLRPVILPSISLGISVALGPAPSWTKGFR